MKLGRKMAAAALALLCMGMAASAAAQQVTEGSRGLLYRVSGGRADMVLLGSIHVGSQDMYPFGDAVQQAMAAADTFVYECDTSSAEAMDAVRTRMRRTGGTLQAELGDALYAQVSQVCRQLGISMQGIDVLKPWAVINTLAVYTTAAEMGTADVAQALALGVELQVQAYAAEQGKKAVYLETLAEQLDALEGFSPALQRYLLQSECDVILNTDAARGLDASIGQWPAWWRDGDAAAFADNYLGSYLQTGFEQVCAEYHDTLVTRRNAAMAERLETLLVQDGSYFVTVGLLHLALPEDSILTHLQEKGYTVTELSRP